jgi:hypothetical protein
VSPASLKTQGVHCTRIYELRLAEDEAVRRVAAARLVRRFPELLDAVAAGELHLTGQLLLGPHLTRENFPSWAEQVASFCPVRELEPGDRPKDWVEPDELSAPARQEAKLEQPLRFKVQFTAIEEHIDLMERAAALLSNRGEHNGIEEIHLRALRALVEELEKRRYGAPQKTSTKALKPAARPARHIPARVRRTVVDRDGACCTHVDPTGQRCRETHHLELHHLVPFARGGGHTAANLTLRCAAHNAYAAELDFSSDTSRCGGTRALTNRPDTRSAKRSPARDNHRHGRAKRRTTWAARFEGSAHPGAISNATVMPVVSTPRDGRAPSRAGGYVMDVRCRGSRTQFLPRWQ